MVLEVEVDMVVEVEMEEVEVETKEVEHTPLSPSSLSPPTHWPVLEAGCDRGGGGVGRGTHEQVLRFAYLK